LAACGPTPTPQVVEKVVTKEVEKVVKETVEVEKVVQATVVVTPTVERTKIQFSRWTWGQTELAMHRMASAFAEEHPEIEIEVTMAGWDEYFTKIETGIASGTAPDVFRHDFGRVARYAFRGITLPLDPLIQADKWPMDTLFPVCIDSYRWQPGTIGVGKGTIWALGDDNSSSSMFINKTMFDKAGLAYPKKGWTWDDFTTVAKALTIDTDGDGEPNQWGTYADYQMEFLSRSWPLWQAGGDWTNADMTKATCNTPEFLDAMHWVCDKVLVHKVAPVPSPQQVDPFQAGLVAMSFTGLWNVTTFATEIKDFEWDIAYAPSHPKTHSSKALSEVDAWAIASTTAKRQAAWELLKFLVGPRGQELFVEDTGWPPANREIAKKWVQLPPPPQSRQVVLDMLESAHPVWSIFGGTEWIDEHGAPTMERVLLGEIPVEQGAAIMQDTLQKAIDDAWQLVKSF
jgi:multiple sugar transport system substrate-binding protein